MKLTRPSRDPLPRKLPAMAAGERVSTPAGMPDWLRERIETKGEFVALSCGHRLNINDRSTLIVAYIPGVYILCERCGGPSLIVRHMKFKEYAGIPEKEESDIPLF